MDIFGMMQNMQQEMDKTKQKLDVLTVTGEAGNGSISVTATGNKKVTNISISASLLADGDADALEDLLMVAINRALDKAEELSQNEMQKVAGGLLPPGFNIPGLF